MPKPAQTAVAIPEPDENPIAQLHFTDLDDGGGAQISGFAITSFVAAFFVPVVAVVFGHLAIRQTRSGRFSGRRMAVAGVILGWFGIIWVGLLIAAIALGLMVVTAGGKIIIG
ncbi:DUF4190 domain-containing protein [Agromyces humi]|uniref:DUF4190 domain-containing protein n=1 Tax=Agromyces humi TaxID=1766800 RepID=UPI001357775D|nr:DUF4190 domain-containing protein [Agromyces humi]